ncbi:MAG: hypothetical protein F6K09_38230, partial [Merismopedia sp. SIO2A8]|nr:hypothetical protein [Merismopedia sp. SIO2A8]
MIAINVAIASLVLGKSLLDPTVGQPYPFELPETVELTHWSLMDSTALEPFTMPTGEPDHSAAGKSYTFTPNTSLILQDGLDLADIPPEDTSSENISSEHINEATRSEEFGLGGIALEDITLTVEMRYILDTNGFIERLLQYHTAFQDTLATVEDDTDIISTIEYEEGVGH